MGRITHRASGVARGLATITLACGVSMLATATPAMAAVEQGNGHDVQPGQPYAGNPASAPDWIGSYMVDGKQAFCVSYALEAPETDEDYDPGDALRTKWGDPIDADIAANISYLLLRHGDTQNNDTAAALAHLLHKWTAGTQLPGGAVGQEVSYTDVAYKVDFHLNGLPAAARQAVHDLQQEAETYRGPWTVELTPPEGEQTIGTPAGWTLSVTAASGKGVPDVPINLRLTGAMLESGKSTGTITTGADGSASVPITPTAEQPKVVATVSAPAEQPRVRKPVDTDTAETQWIVSTGGETKLTAQASVAAQPKPPETTTVVVPRTIPAGAAPNVVAHGEINTGPSPGALVGMGILALLAAALLGWVARRRLANR